MTLREYFLPFTISVTFAVFYFWMNRYTKRKVAAANKTEEFNRKQLPIRAVSSASVGLIFAGMSILQWNRIPEGNTGLAIAGIVFGSGMIVRGCYHWYKHRSSK